MQFPSPRLALGLAALFLFSPATTTPLEVQRRDTLSSAPFPTASATTSTDYRSPPPSSATVARAAMTPYMYACNKTQKSMVLQAWSEAGQLADAHAKWQPPRWFSSGAYQPAMDMYLGTDSRKDAPWFGTGPLRQNINRQQGIHTTSQDWSPYWSYAYIYCDESQVPSKPKKPKTAECNNPTQPDKSVAAYTFPDDGTIFGWNAKYVVLCPRFFDADILTLEQQTNKARSNTSLQTTIDSWRRVKARSLFHETYHWGPAEVSNPRCNLKPEIYDPKKVTSLATNENVAGSRINAESWALAAVACYVQQTFNLKNPPAPEASSTADVIDDIEEHFFDTAPDWFQSPVSLDASSYAPLGLQRDLDVNTPTPTQPSETPTSTTSTPTQPSETPLESCHTQYEAVLDTFDIYGSDWDQSKLDAGGSANSGNGLLTQLRGCSAVTKWKFETLTVSASNPYQWHASGQTTIWQKNCIEHAMTSAGSPSESCSGSG